MKKIYIAPKTLIDDIKIADQIMVTSPEGIVLTKSEEDNDNPSDDWGAKEQVDDLFAETKEWGNLW